MVSPVRESLEDGDLSDDVLLVAEFGDFRAADDFDCEFATQCGLQTLRCRQLVLEDLTRVLDRGEGAAAQLLPEEFDRRTSGLEAASGRRRLCRHPTPLPVRNVLVLGWHHVRRDAAAPHAAPHAAVVAGKKGPPPSSLAGARRWPWSSSRCGGWRNWRHDSLGAADSHLSWRRLPHHQPSW